MSMDHRVIVYDVYGGRIWGRDDDIGHVMLLEMGQVWVLSPTHEPTTDLMLTHIQIQCSHCHRVLLVDRSGSLSLC